MIVDNRPPITASRSPSFIPRQHLTKTTAIHTFQVRWCRMLAGYGPPCFTEKGYLLRLDENVNWRPLVSTISAKSRSRIRPSEAILNRTQLFPPAHNNSAYLRLTVTQDSREHVIILPFDDLNIAEKFNVKLVDLLGQTLERAGALEVDVIP